MTTLVGARTELVAALATAGVRVDVPELPSVRVLGGGLETGGAGAARGQAPGTFRIVMLAGAFAEPSASADLAALAGTVVTAVRGLAGWRLGDVSADRVVRVDGSDIHAAELTAARMIDL